MSSICVIWGIKSGRRRYPHSGTGNYRKSIETASHVLSLIIFLPKDHYHLSLPVWTSPFVILFLQVTSKNLTRFIYHSKKIQLFLTRHIFINILITTFISNSTLVPFLKVSSKDLNISYVLTKEQDFGFKRVLESRWRQTTAISGNGLVDGSHKFDNLRQQARMNRPYELRQSLISWELAMF